MVNTGKLFQKFLGVLLILSGVVCIMICDDGTGIIVLFLMGGYLLLTKEQLIGDDPRES